MRLETAWIKFLDWQFPFTNRRTHFSVIIASADNLIKPNVGEMERVIG